MWFEKILKRFKKNSNCDKCNSPSHGDLYCEECKDYIESIELRKKEQEKAKAEMNQRAWIITRDKFLKEKYGN